ncbi:TPA: hypothetical protein QEM49_003989 [Pseudomonas putida]|uniref:DNA translocase FtsK n=1 Tax=Pseudomonas putida TaxID=303 RepID=UPI00236363C7|nr:DNA translocase FtsK [Pseudomonas putida]MDD2009589.1 hypothetical protein [Pseudomonas putida]HDS1779441.1 hypothetical protein [Pseudomonas putida]
MDTNKMREMREAFERTNSRDHRRQPPKGNNYIDPMAQADWESFQKGWQASREAAHASAISPEVAAIMKRIDNEERCQALRAEAFVRESGRASISALQRHFKIAYGSACRLMDRLVADGVVSPIDSEGRRQVLPKVAP